MSFFSPSNATPLPQCTCIEDDLCRYGYILHREVAEWSDPDCPCNAFVCSCNYNLEKHP